MPFSVFTFHFLVFGEIPTLTDKLPLQIFLKLPSREAIASGGEKSLAKSFVGYRSRRFSKSGRDLVFRRCVPVFFGTFRGFQLPAVFANRGRVDLKLDEPDQRRTGRGVYFFRKGWAEIGYIPPPCFAGNRGDKAIVFKPKRYNVLGQSTIDRSFPGGKNHRLDGVPVGVDAFQNGRKRSENIPHLSFAPSTGDKLLS